LNLAVVWEDPDMIELEIRSSNGDCVFRST